MQSQFVTQAFVTCGDVNAYVQNAVSAVLVPAEPVVRAWVDAHAPDLAGLSFADLCAHPTVVAAVKHDIVERVRDHVRPFELPMHLILEPEPFTPENGRMTHSEKINRMPLERDYRDAIEALLAGDGSGGSGGGSGGDGIEEGSLVDSDDDPIEGEVAVPSDDGPAFQGTDDGGGPDSVSQLVLAVLGGGGDDQVDLQKSFMENGTKIFFWLLLLLLLLSRLWRRCPGTGRHCRDRR